MKKTKFIFLFLILLGILKNLTFCKRQESWIEEGQNLKFKIDENYRISDIESAFSVHNQVMDEIFGDYIQYTNDYDYIESIISSVESKVNFSFDKTQKVFMHDMFDNYLKLNPKDMIDKFVANGMMTIHSAKVLQVINEYMMSKDLVSYSNIHLEIEKVKFNFVENNNTLSEFDRYQLVTFLETVKNSAKHYQNLYDDSLEMESRNNCGRCIKENLWQILLGDGVGGAVLGITGCLVFPPACPALIPALIAIGSGGVLAVRCPHCR